MMLGVNGINNWIYNQEEVGYEFEINDKMDVIIKIDHIRKSKELKELDNKLEYD